MIAYVIPFAFMLVCLLWILGGYCIFCRLILSRCLENMIVFGILFVAWLALTLVGLIGTLIFAIIL